MKNYRAPIVEIVDATDIVTTSSEVETEKVSFGSKNSSPVSGASYANEDLFDF